MTRWLKSSLKHGQPPDVYRKLCRVAGFVGLGPKSQQTPLEYCTEMVSVIPAHAEAVEHIFGAYVESRYSSRKQLDRLESYRLLRSWREVYPALLKRLFRLKR